MAMQIGPESLLAARYRLIAPLGGGGMGVVWCAEHLLLRSRVAVKVIDAAYLAQPEASVRFLREAQAAASLRSPHIVQVFDYGVEDGVAYMVMEFLEGETLGARLERDRSLTFAETAQLVSQIARGLATAHESGIVHRDLKPDNVFLARIGEDEVPKVLDFGVAKLLGASVDEAATTRTTTGVIVGTPCYMSPEQAGGDAVDHRSDLWALAVIAFECVTGVRPFAGRALGQLLMQICVAPIPRPSSLAAVPDGFDEWFARGTERDVDRRFASAREMAEALFDVARPGRPPRGPSAGGSDRTERHVAHGADECRALLSASIEEPARLRQRMGRDYRSVVEECRQIVRAALTGALTVETDIDFESTMATFASATDALAAAVEMQRALAGHEWPKGGVVRVRVALHAATASGDTGATAASSADQQRVDRMVEAAHGGQTLLSDTLIAAVVHRISAGVTLRDLGRHRLDDGDEPEQLYQVVVPGLPSDFPPLRSTGASPNNLLAETTDFVGRVNELRRVQALLSQARLVTLIGPGGEGKTRLALRAAHQLLTRFADGVFFVSLVDLTDAKQFSATVAASLGLAPSSEIPVADALAAHLSTRTLLLVLDNLEQIDDVALHVARLLERAPRVRVLATSRVALGLQQEQLFPVPPLEMPAVDAPLDVDSLTAIDSVALFVRRARAVEPAFTLSAENAAAVTRIVTRLEGLPLAIELVAARVQLASPDVLVRQLERGFDVVRGTARDLPARHRTLHDTVAWSYDLLDGEGKAALRRLGTFAGGFTLEAVEEVIVVPPVEDAVGVLGTLIGSSLVRREAFGSEPRFSMLESIREFAEARLEEGGEAESIRRRHVAHFVKLAEASEGALQRPEQAAVQDRLLADEANLRSAIRFCISARDVESGLRIGGAIWRFWQSAGRLEDGRGWLTELLALPGASPQARAKGLTALAGLEYWQAQYAAALEHYRAARDLYENVGDGLGVARTLFALSTTSSWAGQTDTGARLADEALARFEVLGAREEIGMVRMAQGFVRWMKGDLAAARPLWESSIAIAREAGDHVEAAHKRLALASITFQEGRHAQAIDEAFDAMEELQGHGNVSLTVMALEWIAALGAERAPESCARLAAAASELRRTLGGGMRPEACGLRSVRDTAARLLEPAAFENAWREGTRLRLHEAVHFARSIRETLVSGTVGVS
jgi:predicted ATPase/tRNA A-37 threonylcarbamoyl transferase component Bud32